MVAYPALIGLERLPALPAAVATAQCLDVMFMTFNLLQLQLTLLSHGEGFLLPRALQARPGGSSAFTRSGRN